MSKLKEKIMFEELYKYYMLVENGYIASIGQRAEKGYYCTIILDNRLMPATVYIGKEITEITTTNNKYRYSFPTPKEERFTEVKK